MAKEYSPIKATSKQDSGILNNWHNFENYVIKTFNDSERQETFQWGYVCKLAPGMHQNGLCHQKAVNYNEKKLSSGYGIHVTTSCIHFEDTSNDYEHANVKKILWISMAWELLSTFQY